MKHFNAPKANMGDMNADDAARLLAASSDVALLLDEDGVIRDVAAGSEEMPIDWAETLVGQTWMDTVTVESREKVETLLNEANGNGAARWRHVNHPYTADDDMPILYTTVAIDKESGRIAAVGRDLRPISTLQQRLIEAQHAIERDYDHLRQAEMRYRLLFDMTTEGILIVEAGSSKIVEANPAVSDVLGTDQGTLVGRLFPTGFDANGTQVVNDLLGQVRYRAQVDEVTVRRAGSDQTLRVSASMFRQETKPYFLVRVALAGPVAATSHTTTTSVRAQVLELIDSCPDAFVVTDPRGLVVMANQAFLDMTELATEAQVLSHSLSRWLGRFGSEFNVMLSGLRENGSLRFFATSINGEYGGREDVELSAVAALNAEEPCLGFVIRRVARRTSAKSQASGAMPRSVDQLTELVGQMPLRDIVRDSTDIIERLCIEAALELTGNNRASAAELLGLSRQSFYVKLRRLNIQDSAAEGGNGGK